MSKKENMKSENEKSEVNRAFGRKVEYHENGQVKSITVPYGSSGRVGSTYDKNGKCTGMGII